MRHAQIDGQHRELFHRIDKLLAAGRLLKEGQ